MMPVARYMRPTTMRDVAKLAGVATMTVSRVLSGAAPVKARTKTRVLDAIHRLGYRPNEIARSLRGSKSRQVGIIAPNLYDPFYAACVQAISLVAKSHGYSVITALSGEDADIEFEEANRLRQWQVDGLIVIPVWQRSRLICPELEGTPVVVVDRPVIGSTFDSVLAENRDGARKAVEHLISHGYNRIAYVGLVNGSYTMRRRLSGYRAAIAKARLQHMEMLVGDSKAEMIEAIGYLLSSSIAPRALMCSNNRASINALHALAELQIRIPEEIALVGFDDFEMAAIFNPRITVIRQDPAEMARTAAELLILHLGPAGKDTPRKQISLPVELIVRESCGCRARE